MFTPKAIEMIKIEILDRMCYNLKRIDCLYEFRRLKNSYKKYDFFALAKITTKTKKRRKNARCS